MNNTQLPGTAEEQKRQYDVKKLLERIQSDEKVSSSQAAKELITLVSGAASVASNFIASPSLIEVVGGEKLVAMATDQQHQRIQAELIRLEKFGLTQLLIETRMICIPADQLKEIVLDWQVDIDRSADKPEPNSAVITASAIVKKPRLPVLVAEVTAKQLASVLTKLQSNRHTNIMAAPKLTLFNGMSATISDATLRPFVVGMTQVAPGEKQQPVISIMPDGMSIEFRPELVDQRITLNVEVGLSEIREVKELTYRTTAQPDNAGTTLQVPNVNAFSFQCGTQPIKQGNTLVVATRRLNSSKNEVLMLTLTTSKIDQNSEMDSGALQAAVANRQAAVGAQSKILDLGAKSVETSTSIHGPTLKVGETKVTQPSMDDVIQLLEKSGNHTELLTEIEQRQPKVEMSLKQLSKNTPPARFVPTLGHAQLIRVQYEATLKTSDGQTLGQPIQVEYIQYQLTDPPQPSAGQEVDTFYWENGSPRTAKEPLLPAPVASPRVRK